MGLASEKSGVTLTKRAVHIPMCRVFYNFLRPPSLHKKKESPYGDSFSRLGGFEPTTYRFVAGHSIH